MRSTIASRGIPEEAIARCTPGVVDGTIVAAVGAME
jgi:hypothetical protein